MNRLVDFVPEKSGSAGDQGVRVRPSTILRINPGGICVVLEEFESNPNVLHHRNQPNESRL